MEKLIQYLHNPASIIVMVAAQCGDWRNALGNSLLAYEVAIKECVDVKRPGYWSTRYGPGSVAGTTTTWP